MTWPFAVVSQPLLFGIMGCMRWPQLKSKLAPRGSKCIMLGVAANYPRDTFRICDLSTGHIVERQAISWHPPAGHETDGFIAAGGQTS